MANHLYPTDISDAAWKRIARLLPAARQGGRPRTTDLRAVLNAIFYLLRAGCQWRLLPREYPVWGTVYHYSAAGRTKESGLVCIGFCTGACARRRVVLRVRPL